MRKGLEVVADHLLWPSVIPSKATVIDCGANRGDFSNEMVRRFDARCIAIEPSVEQYEKIDRSKIDARRLAIAGSCGRRGFLLSDNPLGSKLAGSENPECELVEVETITLESLHASLGQQEVDVVKLDIEGAEIEAIDSCSDSLLRSVGQFTVEFHDFNGTVAVAEVERLIARFESLKFCWFRRFRGCYYDTLFVNRAWHNISGISRHAEKFRLLIWGAQRRARAYSSAKKRST